MTCGIYRISCLLTNKCYIGSSVWVEKRFWIHRDELKKSLHHSAKLQNAWNKYGEANFRFDLLVECEKDQLLFQEAFYQASFDSVDTGYNIVRLYLDDSGHIRRLNPTPISEATRLKLSLAGRRKHSEETKLKLSSYQSNRPLEHRENLRQALVIRNLPLDFGKRVSRSLTGRRLSSEHISHIKSSLLGRSFSEEHKANLSEALAGKNFSEEHKANLRKPKKDTSKMSEAARKRLPAQCSHCGRQIAPNWLNRHLASHKEEE